MKDSTPELLSLFPDARRGSDKQLGFGWLCAKGTLFASRDEIGRGSNFEHELWHVSTATVYAHCGPWMIDTTYGHGRTPREALAMYVAEISPKYEGYCEAYPNA